MQRHGKAACLQAGGVWVCAFEVVSTPHVSMCSVGLVLCKDSGLVRLLGFINQRPGREEGERLSNKRRSHRFFGLWHRGTSHREHSQMEGVDGSKPTGMPFHDLHEVGAWACVSAQLQQAGQSYPGMQAPSPIVGSRLHPGPFLSCAPPVTPLPHGPLSSVLHASSSTPSRGPLLSPDSWALESWNPRVTWRQVSFYMSRLLASSRSHPADRESHQRCCRLPLGATRVVVPAIRSKCGARWRAGRRMTGIRCQDAVSVRSDSLRLIVALSRCLARLGVRDFIAPSTESRVSRPG
jgi:hypothetical protein